MKKLLALLLTLILCLSFVACDDSSDSKKRKKREKNDKETVSATTSDKADTDIDDMFGSILDNEETGSNIQIEQEDEAPQSSPSGTTLGYSIEEYMDKFGDEFMEGFEEGFAGSSGMGAKSSYKVDGNTLIITVCIEEFENIDDEQKELIQEIYDGMTDSLKPTLEAMQTVMSDLEGLHFRICEKDGDLIATIKLGK